MRQRARSRRHLRRTRRAVTRVSGSDRTAEVMKQRLDRLLVERGLAESREKAQALIMAGEVLVNSQKAMKPGHSVDVASQIDITGKALYVSRGGLKLAAALESFGINANGLVCLDMGSSTGGFTDCLLQHGAARVPPVD